MNQFVSETIYKKKIGKKSTESNIIKIVLNNI